MSLSKSVAIPSFDFNQMGKVGPQRYASPDLMTKMNRRLSGTQAVGRSCNAELPPSGTPVLKQLHLKALLSEQAVAVVR